MDIIIKGGEPHRPIETVNEHMGVVTRTVVHPDGRQDVEVTVNTVWAKADPEDFAQKLMSEILISYGGPRGELPFNEFARLFKEECKRRGIVAGDIPIIGG